VIRSLELVLWTSSVCFYSVVNPTQDAFPTG